MTKAIIYSGTHPRHMYVHQRVLPLFDEVLAVVMRREELMPEVPQGTCAHDAKNFHRHFEDRRVVECATYGELTVADVFHGTQLHEVEPAQLNSQEIRKRIQAFDADICFIFGCDLIAPDIIEVLPAYRVNLHLGLSPWYKGGATLFWPFYFMEPQFAGCTFHQINERPDAGEVFHQHCPELRVGDGVHDVGARAVVDAASEAHCLLDFLLNNPQTTGVAQRTSGRVWRGVDFMPAHLRVLYDVFDNDLVDRYLANELGARQPKLVSVL